MRLVGDVFRFDQEARDTDPSLQPRWIDWVKSLHLDPNELLPDAVIRVRRETNEYELHVSRVVRRPDGERWIDEAQSCLVSEPVVVPIGIHKVWPEIREARVEVSPWA